MLVDSSSVDVFHGLDSDRIVEAGRRVLAMLECGQDAEHGAVVRER